MPDHEEVADRAAEREAMVRTQLAEPPDYRDPVRDEAVLAAFRRVPRHAFVPPELRGRAYDDRPLPIGEGQTISQPYIVARSVEALGVGPGDAVLEVGAGCGYQAAILAEVGARVVALEVVPALARSCSRRLGELGYGDRVEVHEVDGFEGWPPGAPYDAIVLACATPEVPPPLWDQLAVGGRLVAPVGPVGFYQKLLCRTRLADGGAQERTLDTVRFVPLTRTRYTRS